MLNPVALFKPSDYGTDTYDEMWKSLESLFVLGYSEQANSRKLNIFELKLTNMHWCGRFELPEDVRSKNFEFVMNENKLLAFALESVVSELSYECEFLS